jgi:hypothetical protein
MKIRTRRGSAGAPPRSAARPASSTMMGRSSEVNPDLCCPRTAPTADQDAATALGTRWMLRRVRPIAATKSSMSESVAISGIPPIPRGAT